MVKMRTEKGCVEEDIFSETFNEKKIPGCEGKNLTKSTFRILLEIANRDSTFKKF